MMPESENGELRKPAGDPITLELEYSSAGAFLVAYSTDLAKGALFLETSEPLPVGTLVALHLQAPGAPRVEVQGRIAWSRPEAVGPLLPAGMGIEITTPPDSYGAIVDEIAFGFSGMQVLLGTGEPAPRATLSRYLKSMLSCEVVEVDYDQSFDRLPALIDLAMIDLDSSGARGEHLIQYLRGRSDAHHIPIIVLAQLERDRVRVQQLGASEAMTNPPMFGELQATVVRCIGRPKRLK